ncbi:MAG: Colicin production protein [Glaciihabitans sp.]|nr:Colicin production protein [Glaciihabitans sp.]
MIREELRNTPGRKASAADMTQLPILDIVLVIVLVGYLIFGYRRGLLRSLGAIIGIIGGAVAAVFVIPLLSSWIPEPGWRIAAAFAVVIALLIAGQSLGVAVGSALRRTMRVGALRAVDRLFGAVLSAAAAALVLATVSVSIAALGVPFLSPAITSSTVLRTINDLTPTPAKVFLAQLRSTVTEEGLPQIVEALGAPAAAPALPEAVADTPALATAAQSVVRITGNAYACGQSQSGSGFVVATDRVVTNAHVVAGVSEPVVEVPGGGAHPATIVYFDAVDDLAVLAVTGLGAAPLTLTDTLAEGSSAVANGYPFGGPFVSLPADVLAVGNANINNIYGDDPTARQIYTLAADVQQGDSGGPLLSLNGEVAGVVFAKAESTANLGYAMTMEELSPVADSAASLSSAVSSGNCISG